MGVHNLLTPRRRLFDQAGTVILAAVAIRLTDAQLAALMDRVGFLLDGEPVVEVEAMPSKGTRDWILLGFLSLVLGRPADLAPFDLSTWCEFKVKAQTKGFDFATKPGEPPFLVTATFLPVRLREGPEAWPDMLSAVRAEWRLAPTPATRH